MKLAFCLFNYFPYGGLQRDFIKIAKLCLERQHEVHLFTMKCEGEIDAGIHVHLINVKNCQNHTRIKEFVKGVNQYLTKYEFDLIIGFNKMPLLDVYYTGDVCYKARVQESSSIFYRLTPRYRQLVKMERAVFNRGEKTQILLLSEVQKFPYINHYKTETERFHVMPPGIDQKYINPVPIAEDTKKSIRKNENIKKDEFVLLMVGSGFKTKGVDRAIKSIATMPAWLKEKCHLWVVGKDSKVPYQKLAKKLKVAERIHFLGPRDDVEILMQTADILIHPAYHENTGTVILEAILSGLPVLTLDHCGYASYVKEAKAGIVLNGSFNLALFTQAIEKMLTSLSRQEWQNNGKAFGQNQNLNRLHRKVVDFIEQYAGKVPAKIELKAGIKWIADPTCFKTVRTSDPFLFFMQKEGEVFRSLEGRKTQRVIIGERAYFIKQHEGVGLKEIFKNLIQFRLPVISAKNEWLALSKLSALSVKTPRILLYGERGLNPAAKKSVIVLEELTPTISLEEFILTEGYDLKTKRMLITEVAKIASTLHENGINHRDFYICHFLLKKSSHSPIDPTNLYLIDLHRAQIRNKKIERWIIKDLAALYFSCKGAMLSKRDLLRFIKTYRGQPLGEIFKEEQHFWQRVKLRGDNFRDHTLQSK